MKPIYIVGAGGAAKEILLLIEKVNELEQYYEFKGFIDENRNEFLVIGSQKYIVHEESVFFKTNKEEKVSIVFALGDPRKLKKISQVYQSSPNFDFPNIIHPSIRLDSSVSLGVGNIITEGCIFTADISLQSFNYINRGVHIGHDCSIGSCNVINPCAVISGGVIIQSENLIGTNATVLQYLKIGSKNTIGAGAVLTKNVTNKKCMIGVPGKDMER